MEIYLKTNLIYSISDCGQQNVQHFIKKVKIKLIINPKSSQIQMNIAVNKKVQI